jgi:hypothetical protein
MTVYLAPSWLPGKTLWKFESSQRARNGNLLGRWLEGPLAGREARLEVRTLRRASDV